MSLTISVLEAVRTGQDYEKQRWAMAHKLAKPHSLSPHAMSTRFTIRSNRSPAR